MVTYEPHQAILVRTTPRGIHQVHVQYFGISAVRGWVSQLQYEPLVDTASRKLPTVTIGKKMKCEFEVAIREATEALRLTHKERKLKFIFNFDPLPSTPTTEVLVKSEGAEEGGGRRGEGTMSVKAEVVEEARVSPVKRGDLETTLDKRRKNKRRRNSASCSLSTTSLRMERNEVPLSVRTTSRRRRVRSCSGSGGDAAKNFVVSLPFNGLGKPSGSAPSLLIGESPVTMDSFAVTVDKVLNEACAAGGERDSKRFPEKPPNGMVVSPPAPMRRGPGRPRKNSTSKQNFRHAAPLGKRETRGRRAVVPVECEVSSAPPPVKRLALDPGSESGSEMSGVSIASAILTPPSSGTEAPGEDDRGSVGRMGPGDSHVEANEKPFGRRGRTTKSVSAKSNTRTESFAPEFRSGDCAICDARDSGLLVCQGHCLQAFHVDCLGLVAPPSFQFVCDECQAVPRQCFMCSGSTGPLDCCAKPRCGKFYHRSCIHDDRLFVFDDLKTKFTCPLHCCAKCVCSDLGSAYTPRGSTLVQCVKCPLALHKPHCLVAGCSLISSSQMICYLHIRIESELNLYKHLNMDTCLECGESGSLYCCDFCSSAYHRECMEEHHLPVEEGERRERGVELLSTEKWICPACRDHDLPTYSSVVLCKFGIWR